MYNFHCTNETCESKKPKLIETIVGVRRITKFATQDSFQSSELIDNCEFCGFPLKLMGEHHNTLAKIGSMNKEQKHEYFKKRSAAHSKTDSAIKERKEQLNLTSGLNPNS